jgi:tetratricopeptide (TPR) repeat protein
VDSQTRHALKQDKFVQTTQSGVSWVGEHRSTVIRYSIAVVVVLALLIAGAIFYSQRSEAAEAALGSALDVYSSQLAQPGQPATKGVYATTADRAKAANQQFVQVASQYGWLPEGAKAHYFAGMTYRDLGQNGPAETELKAAAGAWDGNLSSLGKFALAGFYHQTGRDTQAIDLYNGLIAKPTVAVPAYTSQLALADLYSATGKTEQAKQIWAKVKDADKSGSGGAAGSAGAIAAEKLTAKK